MTMPDLDAMERHYQTGLESVRNIRQAQAAQVKLNRGLVETQTQIDANTAHLTKQATEIKANDVKLAEQARDLRAREERIGALETREAQLAKEIAAHEAVLAKARATLGVGV